MKYGIIGKPLIHSFSKPIHESLSSFSYEINELDSNEVSSLLKNRDFLGINVTIPYKQFVIPFLDKIDEQANRIHAVNTIVNRNNILYGYNTDYGGLKKMILDHKIDIKDKICAILGNGGTHNTSLSLLQDLGAKEIITATRKKEKGTLTFDELIKRKDVEVIINTTPVGMYPNNYDRIISLNDFPSLKYVVDVVYNPLRTPLVLEAKERGIIATGGLEMLINQALIANEIFFLKKNDDSLYKSIYKKIYLNKANIVLIGMPMSGKTTIGKGLAKELNKKFYDLDEEIEKRISLPIKDYFSKYGEEKFREIENEVTKEIAKETNLVISTGGGIIKNKDNIFSLKENGFIVLLNRDDNLLIFDDKRPLTKNKSDYHKLLNERLPIYRSCCDTIIDNNDSIEEATKKIKEAFDESFNY